MKTATHKAKGAFKYFYYRKLQVKTIKHHPKRSLEWQFYCPYTNKWMISECPHSGITEL